MALLLHDGAAIVSCGAEGLAIEPGVILCVKGGDYLSRLSAPDHATHSQNPSIVHQGQGYAEPGYFERRLVNHVQVSVDCAHRWRQYEVTLVGGFVHTAHHVDGIVSLELAGGEH